VWCFRNALSNSTVIPGELAIKLQPPADQPLAEARPGIQENQKRLDTRFSLGLIRPSADSRAGYDGGKAADLLCEIWFQDNGRLLKKDFHASRTSCFGTLSRTEFSYSF
jgi:hypothetical protein